MAPFDALCYRVSRALVTGAVAVAATTVYVAVRVLWAVRD